MTKHPQRRTIRLDGYDYTVSGAYFVTICTHEKRCLFGTIKDEIVELNAYGQIVFEEWELIAVRRPYVALDAFVIMPNHIHGVVLITANNDIGGKGAADAINRVPTKGTPRQFGPLQTASLSSIVALYKAGVTRQINRLQNERCGQIWQERYYEHIIRNEADLNRIRQYIQINPAKWAEDRLYGE